MFLFRNSRFKVAWTISTIALIALLLFNSLIYLGAAPAPFLVEKGELVEDRIWNSAFHFHVLSSCIILVAGAVLFFESLLKFKRVHRVLGYTYFNGVLWVAAPTGLILAPFAKGGLLAAAGFAVTGLLWWGVTWLGYRAIIQGRASQHVQWMVRSWCIALSAVSFRVFHFVFFVMGVETTVNYITSIWLSLFVNVWLAEWFVTSNFSKRRLVSKRHGPVELTESVFMG